jgi:hypothetical protein
MNLLHLNRVLLVIVFSITSGVLGGASRGQEQNLHRRRGLRKAKELEDPYRMNSSKKEVRASTSRKQGKHKDKASSVPALKSVLHLSQPFPCCHASPL